MDCRIRDALKEEWQRAVKEVAHLDKPELTTTLGLEETFAQALAKREAKVKRAREHREEAEKAYLDHCRAHGCQK